MIEISHVCLHAPMEAEVAGAAVCKRCGPGSEGDAHSPSLIRSICQVGDCRGWKDAYATSEGGP